MIRIRGLYKYYGRHKAVGSLSADITQGEVVGLLGLNGAGKTTTLRVLACDLLPSAGTVEVDGVDVVQSPDRVRAMIGYLPDTPPLYDEMSVRRFLRFAAELRGVGRTTLATWVGAALEETRLVDVAELPIGSLSHGYRQRVGIAQAIVHRPKLVVLDEPSSGLDPVQIKDMRTLVRGISGERTVLVSSHNLTEISEMCDRLLVIGDGEIVASGSEAELVSRLLEGERVEVSVRIPDLSTADGPQRRDDAAALLRGVTGVTGVESESAKEPSSGVCDFVVTSDSDVRGALAKAIVGAGLELLTLTKNQHELETVFSKLATSRAARAADGAESEAA
jgi:ABC-2 type transport system ATP-binding protein